MNKTLTLSLTESEYHDLLLWQDIGSLIHDLVEALEEGVTKEKIIYKMELQIKFAKAGYDAGFTKQTFKGEDIYSSNKKIESEKNRIIETYSEYIRLGQDIEDMKYAEEQLKKLGLIKKR